MVNSCSFSARIGRRLRHAPNSGAYDVCLTPTQRQALFGARTPGKPIGCGTFACVWDQKPGRVVKLTRDREDVEGLRATRGLRRVVKVFEARTLPSAGVDARTKKRFPVYAIVAERLQPLTKAQHRELDRPLERARIAMLNLAKRYRGRPAAFKVAGGDTAELARGACAKTPGAGCERFVRSFVDGWSDMFRRGIVWQDAHTGNIALDKAGNWKAIDLGYSGTKRRTNIPALHGAR